MKPRVRRALRWLGTAAGVGIVALMLRRLDPGAVLGPLLASDPMLLLLVALLMGGVQLLSAVAPAILLAGPVRAPLPLWSRVKVFLATQPLAIFAPGRLSDFGAMALLRRNYPTGAVASAVVLDKLITILVLLVLAPPALHFVWPGGTGLMVNTVLVLTLVLVAAMPFVLLDRRVRSAINRTVLRFWPGLLEGFGAHLESLLGGARRLVLANLALTLIKTALSAFVMTLLGRNVGLEIGLGTAWWVCVLTQLATSVPVSIQGIGVAEGALVVVLGANGYPEALALSMGVMARVLLVPVYGAIYLVATVPLLSRSHQ